MEHHLKPEKDHLRNHHQSQISPASQNSHLPERPKPEKHLSYSDFHHHITGSASAYEIPTKSRGDRHKQHKKVTEEDELVKYMSNVPSYLEKGRGAPQEKVLNVGVLDWNRLERWQHSQHNRRVSVSGDNSGSLMASAGYSLSSSRDPNVSPSNQRTHRPSLQFHLPLSSSSSLTGRPQLLKSSGEGNRNPQDRRSLQTNTRVERAAYTRTTGKAVSHDPIGMKFDEWKRKLEGGKMTSGSDYEAQHVVKEMKIVDQGNLRRPEKRQERKVNVKDSERCHKSEPVVILLPTDDARDSHGITESPKLTKSSRQRSTELPQKKSLEKPREISYTVVSSNVPHSCPLPNESERKVETQKSSRDAESICSIPHPSLLGQNQAEINNDLSHFRAVEAKDSTVPRRNSSLRDVSSGANPKPSKVTAEKVRSTSPFRRLSMGMGKLGRSLMSSSEETSSCDKRNATSRGKSRSSPLRRLLDPLMKPKVPANCHLREPSQKDPTSADMWCRSSPRQVRSSSDSPLPGRVSLDATDCRSTNLKDFPRDMKKKSTALQALLRVAVKNGQPLFTFAVDNEPDILAATVKELSSSNSDFSCVYTLFSIQEAKKKNRGSWTNQGSKCKGKGQEICSNVVAQLRVSGTQFSSQTASNCMEQHSFGREYVLSAVDFLQQAEQQQALDVQPNDELAAIVIKFFRAINMTPGDHHEYGFTSASSSVTAILPGGVHSIPAKGGPSSLLERWRSGGSCDCGGWDLGCNLRVLASLNQHGKPGPFEPCSTTDKFELIPQGGEGENELMFSLAAFKDGIHSIEFHPSISTLQAFSLCIAAVDSKKLMDEKASLETIAARSDGVTTGTGTGREVPPRYISYPPLSPAGRV